MSRRKSYSETHTGAVDEGIRQILEGPSGSGDRLRLKKMLLKVINNELTPRQNQIIMLYYFCGKDIVTIARELCVSPQAVSAVMSRARLRMFRILQYYL